ncbi:MAG TPA: hypothetical protein PKE25_11940, partial [Novosphingobium sp.]|nr:hypothetical protein [Novosphingobium sp.]
MTVIEIMPPSRHAELGSPSVTCVPASIAPPRASVRTAKWTLERKSPKVKQVQGDDIAEVAC